MNPEAHIAATLRKILDQHMMRDIDEPMPWNFVNQSTHRTMGGGSALTVRRQMAKMRRDGPLLHREDGLLVNLLLSDPRAVAGTIAAAEATAAVAPRLAKLGAREMAINGQVEITADAARTAVASDARHGTGPRVAADGRAGPRKEVGEVAARPDGPDNLPAQAPRSETRSSAGVPILTPQPETVPQTHTEIGDHAGRIECRNRKGRCPANPVHPTW